MPSTRSLISDKARCFSQSESALYGNFIIIIVNNINGIYNKFLDGDWFSARLFVT